MTTILLVEDNKNNADRLGRRLLRRGSEVVLSDRDRSLTAGCNEYTTKPVDISRLLQKIDTLLTARAFHE